MLRAILHALLAIPSPTFKEQEKTAFIMHFIQTHCPGASCEVADDNLVVRVGQDPHKTTIGLVGHSDVVPDFFKPYDDGTRVHGAGASDMQAALAVYLYLMAQHYQQFRYNVVLIVYAREEGTPLHKNGLYHLLHHTSLLPSCDAMIVGEPTDNTIQCGCVGSLHAEVVIAGQAAHSARPWHGVNALYEAMPFINMMATLTPHKHIVSGLAFFEVASITTGTIGTGRTTVPEAAQFNVNKRFSPGTSQEDAFDSFKNKVLALGIAGTTMRCLDSVYAGEVPTDPFTTDLMSQLALPIEAKQAWTDVAQLTRAGIPAFNFGPGQQAQAHQRNESVDFEGCSQYYQHLKQLLVKE